MPDIHYQLHRRIVSFDDPIGKPYVPPEPKPGVRHRVSWPQRIKENWTASRNGLTGAGRSKKAAKAALRRAEVGARA